MKKGPARGPFPKTAAPDGATGCITVYRTKSRASWRFSVRRAAW